MTEQRSGFEDRSDELVRTQDFETPHPIELDINNNAGSIRIELAETPVTHIEVRHDPSSAGPDWRSGLSGLLNWVSEQFGEGGLRPGGDGPREPLAEAVHQTRIDLTGSRLAVRGPAAPRCGGSRWRSGSPRRWSRRSACTPRARCRSAARPDGCRSRRPPGTSASTSPAPARPCAPARDR
ncbi:hypothetical protein ACFQ0O_30340 [Saccharopolyspora spinosporotrichia]